MSDRPDSYFTMFTGDYLRDTMHLTTRQHGAYVLLLMHYYGKGLPLPLSDDTVRTIARELPQDWKVDRPTVMAFFVEGADGWHQPRADKELVKAAVRYEKAVKAAKAKHGPKQPPSTDPSSLQAGAGQCPSGANPNPNPIVSKNHSKPTDSACVDAVGPRKPARTASKAAPWPSDRVVEQAWILDGTSYREAAKLPAVDLRLEAERFANHFAGNGKRMKDWRRTWLNWCISPYVGVKSNGAGQPRKTPDYIGNAQRQIERLGLKN